MILEGLVTTMNVKGGWNVAPMGPRIEANFDRFVLRPFRTSTTYKNLKHQGEGVLHVSDDVLLLARATIGPVPDAPTQAAEQVKGRILLGCCRYYEFRVVDLDDREERATIQAETVGRGTFREFFGFNRAQHAVIETAILASRIGFLPLNEMEADLVRYRILVEKTGGAREADAFKLLKQHIYAAAGQRGGEPGLGIAFS